MAQERRQFPRNPYSPLGGWGTAILARIFSLGLAKMTSHSNQQENQGPASDILWSLGFEQVPHNTHTLRDYGS